MRSIIDDCGTCLAFLTRIKLPSRAHRPLARAAWAFPVAGLAVGGLGSAAYAGALWLGFPWSIASLLALAAMMLITGALHEDGLADCADGFFGGHARERKLAIMQDSRIGTFGMLALLMVTSLRFFALAAFPFMIQAVAALLSAACVSRACMAVMMRMLPLARADGLAASAGAVSTAQAAVAMALALTVAAALTQLHVWLVMLAAALALALALHLSRRHIGGYSGDTLGMTQQLAEAFILVALTLGIA